MTIMNFYRANSRYLQKSTHCCIIIFYHKSSILFCLSPPFSKTSHDYVPSDNMNHAFSFRDNTPNGKHKLLARRCKSQRTV